MNPIRFDFDSVHDEKLIMDLANLLGTTPVESVLQVPNAFGSGSIVRKQLDEGLVIVCWDFQLNTNVIFSKKQSSLNEDARTFTVNYLVAADHITMWSPSLRKHFFLNGHLNILFFPEDVDLDFELKAGVPARVVSVSIRPEWIKKELGGIQLSMTNYIHQLLLAEKPSVFVESSTPDEFRIAGDILKHSLDIPKGILNLKPRVMTLVADFFSRISNKPLKEAHDSRIMHYQKMQEVEALLISHMERSLPDIDTIARSVTLSVSTLKRHFKMAFGKGVYEYYLELKMEHAKRLLMTKDISVNEVAFRLNYEKVSSFIDMFKKLQGFSPGSLRRNAS